MSSHLDVLGSTAVVLLVVMVATWLVSLVRRDTSIVDIVWGLAFVSVAWTAWGVGDGNVDRADLLTVMVTIWGGRLAWHLWRRSHGRGEDFRYRSMRRRHGASWPMRSLVTVFLAQGVLVWIVSLPVQLAMTPLRPAVGAIGVIGIVVWGVGLCFETLADAQLTRFRADPDNADQVLDQGLWRYSRHPNYFGDACVWWGLWLVAAESRDAAWAIASPILMTVLLLGVSGVPPLERSLRRRRPGYDEYVATTSRFLPRSPRRSEPT